MDIILWKQSCKMSTDNHTHVSLTHPIERPGNANGEVRLERQEVSEEGKDEEMREMAAV